MSDSTLRRFHLGRSLTSSYLTGSVAAAALCVSGTTAGLQMSPEELQTVRTNVISGCLFLRNVEPRARIKFDIDQKHVTISATPCSAPSQDSYETCEAPWRDAALMQLGFPIGEPGLAAYAESIRARFHSEWVFIGLFTKYPLHHFAYALGQRLCMEYSNDGWHPGNIDRVFAHEVAHLFGAADEYTSSGCDCGSSGYLDVPNMNCENCIERLHVPCLLNANTWDLCTWSRGQLGWYPRLLGGVTLLHQQTRDPTVAYATLDRDKFSEDIRIAGWQSVGPPGLAVYNDVLYCAHANSSGQLALTTFDGSTWSADESVQTSGGEVVKLAGTPALAAYDGKLMCLHRRPDDDGWLYETAFDGISWSRDQRVMTPGPTGKIAITGTAALAIIAGMLFCLHQGRGGSAGWLYQAVLVGPSWSQDEQVITIDDGRRGRVGITGSPALASYNQKVYCLHQGRNSNGLLYQTDMGSDYWSTDTKVRTVGGLDIQLADSPALAVEDGLMFCVHRVKGDTAVRYTVFDGSNWANEVQITSVQLPDWPALIGGLKQVGHSDQSRG